ncbi:ATP synthase F1 subcomplex gamma subunit [Hydrogenispora ethanolica]|jgi:F-type H+-transporting ATPase subunit gamma|uniref:ATP synthase gamma chain n=1 Tax=Hydrogenispora ethanolica TaxID=1082276 RepID=A0A4R1RBL3_HYDET|nr:ATP synthase F1 subunit gamma [Hydrogenispora ethanolica]TCL63020.1 ATP synthase F1 subcomplex gamma subunit [Hydrogenispora ethanolica]
MASIRDLRLKIKSIKNIQHITKAMKMVASARLKKVQDRLEAARPYARKMAEVTLDLASRTPEIINPLLLPHEKNERVLILVFTGDRGLAGGFHQKIADGAVQFSQKFKGHSEVSFYGVGSKGIHRLSVRHIELFKKFTDPVGGVTFEAAQKLAEELIEFYLSKQFDQIFLYYAKFHSAMTQRPKAFQLLPIDPSKTRQREERGLFIYEPDQRQVLDGLLPRYITSEVFRAFLETETGELGAKMTAMSSATDNAAELIERYSLEFNKIRQSQITTEIAEIVGGAGALES